MSSPDNVIIDLTGDSDEEVDQEQRLGNIRRYLERKRKTKNSGRVKQERKINEEDIIVLDSDSEDEQQKQKRRTTTTAAATAGWKTTGLDSDDKEDDGDDDYLAFEDVDGSPSKKSKVKQEGQKKKSPISKRVSMDIEIVEPTAPQMVPVANRNNGTNVDDDDDIIIAGVTNEVRLPHLRHNCTNHPFNNTKTYFAAGFGTAHAIETNKQSCDLCYCYVCDCPVKDCKEWTSSCHCCATNKDTFWENKRKIMKRMQESAGGTSAAAASTTATAITPPPTINPNSLSAPSGYHFYSSCPRRWVGTGNASCPYMLVFCLQSSAVPLSQALRAQRSNWAISSGHRRCVTKSKPDQMPQMLMVFQNGEGER